MKGFLEKKSNSMMRGWQTRWFASEGLEVKYYLENDEVKQRGTWILQNICNVYPDSMNNTRFDVQFEDASTVCLRAGSREERDAWVGYLMPWVAVISLEDKLPMAIPVNHYEAMIRSCRYLVEHGAANVEGVFRVPGLGKTVDAILQGMAFYGEAYFLRKMFPEDTTVFDVGSAIKQLLRELPTPLLTWALADDFTKVRTIPDLRDLVWRLPEQNVTILVALAQVCRRMVANPKVTLMSCKNMGVCIGPCIVRVEPERLAFLDFTPLFSMLLDSFDQVFGDMHLDPRVFDFKEYEEEWYEYPAETTPAQEVTADEYVYVETTPVSEEAVMEEPTSEEPASEEPVVEMPIKEDETADEEISVVDSLTIEVVDEDQEPETETIPVPSTPESYVDSPLPGPPSPFPGPPVEDDVVLPSTATEQRDCGSVAPPVTPASQHEGEIRSFVVEEIDLPKAEPENTPGSVLQSPNSLCTPVVSPMRPRVSGSIGEDEEHATVELLQWKIAMLTRELEAERMSVRSLEENCKQLRMQLVSATMPPMKEYPTRK